MRACLPTERAEERSGPARADAVLVHRVHYAVFDRLVAEEIVVVVRGEIDARPAVDRYATAGLWNGRTKIILFRTGPTDDVSLPCWWSRGERFVSSIRRRQLLLSGGGGGNSGPPSVSGSRIWSFPLFPAVKIAIFAVLLIQHDERGAAGTPRVYVVVVSFPSTRENAVEYSETRARPYYKLIHNINLYK